MSENKLDNDTIRAIGLLVLLGIGGLFFYDHYSQKDEKLSQKQISLYESVPSTLSPYGKLPDVFNLMSDYTDLQRENLSKEIIGQVVSWTLPIYEVEKISANKYKVYINSGKHVGCILQVVKPDEAAINTLNSLKTGDYLHFKGYIKRVTAERKLLITPVQLLGGPITNMKRGVFVFDECFDQENVQCLSGKLNSSDACLFTWGDFVNVCRMLNKGEKYRVLYYVDEVMPDEDGIVVAGFY